MKALVLAAGFGSRFRPVTNSMAKPMIPLCNRPLLGWAIEPLLEAGVDQIIINLHHKPEGIRDFATSQYGSRASIEFSFEAEILGTGGAIRRLAPKLRDEEMFFLVNADTLQSPPLDAVRQALLSSDAIACLVLRHPPEGDKYTSVFFEDGFITGFGNGTGEALMFSGSHALRGKVVSMLPDVEFSGITEDVYLPLARTTPRSLAAVIHDGLWFDIGTPLRYQGATQAILSLYANGNLVVPAGNELTSAGSLVHGAAACESNAEASVIGAFSTIETGVTMTESVVWDRCRISAGSRLRRSVVAHDVVLRESLEIENALVCNAAEGEVPAGTIRRENLTFSPIDPSRAAIVQSL